MATRVVHSLQTQARFGGLKFVVLIGGVPPVELVREGGGDGDWGPQNVAATQVGAKVVLCAVVLCGANQGVLHTLSVCYM